jgi:hypothetical protein
MNSILKNSTGLFAIFLLLLTGSAYSQNLDIRILRSVNSSKNLPSDNFFRFVSDSDGWLVVGIPVVIGTAGFIKHDKTLVRNGCVILASVAINGGITEIIKYTVKRDGHLLLTLILRRSPLPEVLPFHQDIHQVHSPWQPPSACRIRNGI